MRKPLCFSRGHILQMQDAAISVNDLGVQRGYGIFDFLRVSRNIPLFMDDHLDRFFHSASGMGLTLTHSREEIKEIIKQLIDENDLPDSGVRILLTGGESPDGYQIVEPILTIIQQLIKSPADEINKPGIHLLTYPFQRQLPEVKTTDYLMAIWLQPWLKERGGDDILYCHDGIVLECPRSNFFMVTNDGILVTPFRNMLKGITRKKVLELAKEMGIPVEERDISLADLMESKEAFITSSTKRLIPVRQIDEKMFKNSDSLSMAERLWQSFLSLEKSF